MTRMIVALFLALVFSPAMADGIRRYPAPTNHLTDADSGYVLAGAAGGVNLHFVHVERRQEYKSVGSFCGRLPVGNYELYRINSVNYGVGTADSPFKFKVVAGQRDYIGIVSPPWSSDDKKFAEQSSKNPAVRIYDIHWMNIKWDVTVFDVLTEDSKRLQKRCKDVDISEFKTLLMS